MCVCGYVGTSHEFMGFEFRRGSLQSALDLTETAAHRNWAAVSVPRSWQLAVELCLKLHSKLRCFLTEFALFSERWVSDPSIASPCDVRKAGMQAGMSQISAGSGPNSGVVPLAFQMRCVPERAPLARLHRRVALQ